MGIVNQVRVRPAVDRPRTDLELLRFGQEVVAKTTGNANFNPAPPALADLSTAVTSFDAAISNARAQKGAALALDKARQDVIDALNHLADQVGAVTEKQPPDTARAMIASVGFRPWTITVRTKQELAVKHGSVSGVVVLIALAVAKSALYEWQISSDSKSWSDASTGWKANATIAGLTPGQTYFFRFRAQSRGGTTDWSQVVSIIVM